MYEQIELLTLSDLDVTLDPDYYAVKVGDFCSVCQTKVRTRWSGIACDCGRVWFCY